MRPKTDEWDCMKKKKRSTSAWQRKPSQQFRDNLQNGRKPLPAIHLTMINIKNT
jgi:hypothetical protein